MVEMLVEMRSPSSLLPTPPLQKLGSTLVSADHYDSAGITTKMAEITAKRDALLQNAGQRGDTLVMSKNLQQFLRNVYEVSGEGENLQ